MSTNRDESVIRQPYGIKAEIAALTEFPVSARMRDSHEAQRFYTRQHPEPGQGLGNMGPVRMLTQECIYGDPAGRSING
jgi:hypothetical protein